MSLATAAPKPKSTRVRKRYTVADCNRMRESGELSGRYELIDGEIIRKMGQNAPHRLAIQLVSTTLQAIFGPLHVLVQSPVIVQSGSRAETEPEPDVTVTPLPGTSYSRRNPRADECVLLVEVADTSLKFDLSVKARLYAKSGVAEYWVLDLTGRCLHRFSAPAGARYENQIILSETELVQCPGRTETISVLQLLPAETTEETEHA